MDQQNHTLAKIPILDIGKFEQWQFRIQQYFQHEHYALWKVIEFGDYYVVPASAETIDTASDGPGQKKGRTVTLTTEEMQKRKNYIKARTTLLLSLPDEHQLRFTEGSETLDQTFNRLHVIVSQLQFMDVEIKQDDLNQKFVTSLDPEWLMHTIVWRNRSDLNTMSLDDLGNEDVNTASVSTASTNVPTASTNIGVASISQDTTCTYIASQSSSSQIKFKDINQIDKDDMEEMDIKWNIALLSMRADKFWKKTGKKISIQGTDVAGFDKSKDWSYMANDEENHALVAEKEAPTEFALMANTSAERLAQVESRLVEHKDREIKYCEKIRGLEYKIESSDDYIEILKKKLELIKKEKESLDGKLASFQTASKDLDSLLESQRLDKNKEGLGYSVVPPPPAQIYSSPKKDMSWTGLSEFKDDIVTDYSRPAPTVEISPDDAQNRSPFVTKTEASPSTISPKFFSKFVKANDSPTTSKTDKAEKAKKSPVKYAEQYRM
uniref:Uncharacterized protein n=1 Tax=Tanacetum cinerariifolium TaxID=118510 RepID=A0A699IQ85_TANCI|nr:hypothetical protein [Tanacetum cinerariifolium]